MDVTIQEVGDRDGMDSEMRDLLDTLVRCFGDGLPDAINGVTHNCDRYDLHVATNDLGNAYGETLATHGWTVVGFHSHKTDDDSIDKITVKRIEECDNDQTIMYSSGDEDKIKYDTN